MQYIYNMSIERHERSPSFRTRQKTAKVNHNSKLLPNDFFPKTLSQSPKKRPEFPCSAEVLDWYQRDESKEKPNANTQPHPQFHRLSHNRPSAVRISFCHVQEPSPADKQRYVLDYYQQIKQKLGAKLIQPQRIEEDEVRGKRQRMSLIRQLQPASKEKEQKRIRIIRSQTKPRQRRDTSQSLKKSIRAQQSPSRRSLRQLPKRPQLNEVAVGFDGMVTFSRFK